MLIPVHGGIPIAGEPTGVSFVADASGDGADATPVNYTGVFTVLTGKKVLDIEVGVNTKGSISEEFGIHSTN